MQSESLEGKSVIVTGGGGGIGRATAWLFAERGACVTVADVPSDTAEAVAAEIVSNSGQAAFVRTDVFDAGDEERVVETPMASRVASESAGARETLETRHPQRRFGSPDEVVAAVMWLRSDASSFTIGHALTVDGGIVAQ